MDNPAEGSLVYRIRERFKENEKRRVSYEPGEGFQSPSSRRYLELDVRLISDAPDRATSLDWIAVEFTPPLATRAVGEIHPMEVRPGEQTEFTYFLRPQGVKSGFDRLAVEASTPVRFTEAYVNEESVEVRVDARETGFRATFPRAIRSNQLVELRFESADFL